MTTRTYDIEIEVDGVRCQVQQPHKPESLTPDDLEHLRNTLRHYFQVMSSPRCQCHHRRAIHASDHHCAQLLAEKFDGTPESIEYCSCFQYVPDPAVLAIPHEGDPVAGDSCPRCNSTDTWVTMFEEEPALVCRVCGLDT